MTFWLNDICHYHLAWQLLRHESETRTLSMIWETVLTWYLTWHLLVTCCHYDIVTTTRYKSIIILCQVVSAHCSVVSAVSTYLRDLLKEVYPGEGRDQVILASHWSTLYNTDLWLVHTLQYWPLIGWPGHHPAGRGWHAGHAALPWACLHRQSQVQDFFRM